MNGAYFDWKIFGYERLTQEERRLRERLQTERSARETLCSLEKDSGLRRDRGNTRRIALSR